MTTVFFLQESAVPKHEHSCTVNIYVHMCEGRLFVPVKVESDLK